MSIIQKMPDALAHLIAAGEVVQRAASVVKELVENAIDAKATHIQIQLDNLGIDQIIVTDNGTGMDKEDLHLAFLAHGTSKIFKPQDLQAIKTLGFRGEAIPSIASVAKVTLQSRMIDTEGFYVTYHQTVCTDQGHIAMNVGTKVIVKDLFYNTPARFKYLKSEFSERNAVLELFDKFALSHPEISFSLTLDQKLIKQTPGNNLMSQLIDEIFGKNMAAHAKYFETVIQKVTVKGYLFAHHITKSHKKDMHLFVNGRMVKNYTLTQSIVEGYHSYLMTNRYPMCFINIEIDPSLVDVNVHPQKLEVKLSNEYLLGSQLTEAIKSFLKGPIEIDQTRLEKVKKEVFTKVSMDALLQSVEEKTLPIQEKEVLIENPKDKIPDFDYIGTLAGTYLLFQNQDGLYMIDQHAAAERVRYEHYETVLKEVGNEAYQLLVPHELLLNPNDVEVLIHHQNNLKKFGFNVDHYVLSSHPIWIRNDELDLAVESIVHMLKDSGQISISKLRDQLAKDISCKGAIKANHQLSIDEINHLMKSLRSCYNPYTCPHGRPVIIKLTYTDIERMFKRIVS